MGELASGWQSIDSAPKDGRFIRLKGGVTDEDFYSDKTDAPCKRREVVAKWLPDNSAMALIDGVDGHWVFCFWDGSWRQTYENPTHWAPAEVGEAGA